MRPPRRHSRDSCPPSSRDSSIHLPDGRLLAYAEWGDPDGRPVFLFHGMPGSRLFFPDPVVAAEARVRAITVDRPGIGRSDPQPGHRVADWPRDVLALAQELGLDRFGVIGWSAGTPYAMACAAVIRERLTGAAAMTSAASLRYLFDDDTDLRDALLEDDERAIREALSEGSDAAERRAASEAAEWVRGLTEHPEQLAEGADAGDEWFLDDPERRSSFIRSIHEAVRQGAEAMAPQFAAQVAPWGFRLEDISMRVHVWAGANDATTPPELMRRVAERIRGHTFTVWEDVGHAGLAKHLDEVLGEL
ncbi:MAG TPA: alpha/beta hydrolase [Actinomycetota bacterium]|nr:alpha/beta hydrolase [Actinomycetota bacterium]